MLASRPHKNKRVLTVNNRKTPEREQDKKTNPSYHVVTLKEAQENNSYWHVMRNMFREQAARVFQRRWRATKGRRYDQKKYTETLTNYAKLLRFIQEPLTDKCHEHAQKIVNGRWLELDFADPEFERNIYKALRLKLIDRQDLGTALLLHHAQIEFGNKAKQFNFTESGPYQPGSVTYSTSESITDFYSRLSALPSGDQCYFSVNFSRLREALFLYDILTLPAISKPEHRYFLEMFIARLRLPASEAAVYTQAVANLVTLGSAEEKAAKNTLKGLIKNVYREFESHFNEGEIQPDGIHVSFKQGAADENSQHLLTAIYSPGPQMPMVRLSQDFNKDDLQSPLLCMIIPTIPALIALQEAMHGEVDTTYPYFTAGQVSTRMIRDLDENPHKYGQSRQSRPVELVHPDLVPNQSPHGWYKVHSFILSWHDVFHCWQNGMVTDKPLIRHLRCLLADETGYDMSKAVWLLSDMDITSYLNVRESNKNNNPLLRMFSRAMAVSAVLHNTGKDFWSEKMDGHDVNLLLIIDMIMNHASWTNKFLPNVPPEELFKMDGPNLWRGTNIVINGFVNGLFYNRNLDCFHSAFAKLKEFIDADRAASINRPAKYYILAYRLRKHPGGLDICRQFDAAGTYEILRWNRNGGMKLPNNVEIAGLDETNLVNALNELLNQPKKQLRETLGRR